MIDRINPRARSDAYGSKINRSHSPLRAIGIPVVTILLGSLSPWLPFIASVPLLPPLGYLFFVAWRLGRPGLLPMWSGAAFGLIDDLFSGQPFGSAIFLWSLTLLVIEAIETRFPWRSFFQDWLVATALIAAYLFMGAVLAGIVSSPARLALLLPQFLFAMLFYPILARFVAMLDRFRLRRVRRLG